VAPPPLAGCGGKNISNNPLRVTVLASPAPNIECYFSRMSNAKIEAWRNRRIEGEHPYLISMAS
jgi:hypothetical protein